MPSLSSFLALLAALHSTFAVPLSSRNAACNSIAFHDTFPGGDYRTHWQDKSDHVGRFLADPSGKGLNIALDKPGEGAMVLRSLHQFTPPTTFNFIIQAASNSGIMSDIVLYDGTSANSEIDLELMGYDAFQHQIMMPIWQDNHLFSTIPLSNPPKGWPANAGGPRITTSDGFVPRTDSNGIIENWLFSSHDKHNFTLEWHTDKIVWHLDGNEAARYTRGSNADLWPKGPLPLYIGLWGGGSMTWLGAVDKSYTPTFKIFEVYASGCSA